MHRLYKSHFFTQFAKLFLLIPNRNFSAQIKLAKTKKQTVDGKNTPDPRKKFFLDYQKPSAV